MEDLLPGPQDSSAIAYGDRYRRSQPRCLQVRVTVAVVPHLFVSIGATRRQKSIQDLWKITLEARFILDRANRSRTAHIEDVHKACGNA